MGNCLFSFGSSLIDCFGFGYRRKHHQHIDGEESEEEIDRNERIFTNVEKMEEYCKPLLFINFIGQTTNDEVRNPKIFLVFFTSFDLQCLH